MQFGISTPEQEAAKIQVNKLLEMYEKGVIIRFELLQRIAEMICGTTEGSSK